MTVGSRLAPARYSHVSWAFWIMYSDPSSRSTPCWRTISCLTAAHDADHRRAQTLGLRQNTLQHALFRAFVLLAADQMGKTAGAAVLPQKQGCTKYAVNNEAKALLAMLLVKTNR